MHSCRAPDWLDGLFSKLRAIKLLACGLLVIFYTALASLFQTNK
jgi:hypothetical protein